MSDDPKKPNALAEFLGRCQVSPERAEALAAQVMDNLKTAAPGTVYLGVSVQQLPDIWDRAWRAGHAQLQLEITCASPDGENDGKVNVKIIGRDQQAEVSAPELEKALSAPAPLQVPQSWDDAVEEMCREGAMTVEEWERQSGAEPAKRVLN